MKPFLVILSAIFLFACSNTTKNANGTVTTNYGFNLVDVIDSAGMPDSVVVQVSVNGKVADTLKFDSTKFSGTILKFPIVEPDNDQITVEYKVWKGGQVVATNTQTFVSGESPSVPRPNQAPKVKVASDSARIERAKNWSPVVTASDPENQPIKIYWSWKGNGSWDDSASKADAFSTKYDSVGDYLAIVKVVDNMGLLALDSVHVTVVAQAPMFAVTNADTVCINDTVPLHLTYLFDSPRSAIGAKIRWDIAGALDTLAADTVRNLRFATPGSRFIRLALVDSYGTATLDSTRITAVIDSPSVNPGSDGSGFTGSPVAFGGTAGKRYGRVVRMGWSFTGDTTGGHWDTVFAAVGSSFLHTYDQVGNYQALFFAEDQNGTRTVGMRNMNITRNASTGVHVPNFSGTGWNPSDTVITIKDSVTFTLPDLNYSDPNGSSDIKYFKWDFGNGVYAISNQTNVVVGHRYPTMGTYVVKLKLEDSNGDSVVLAKNIHVLQGIPIVNVIDTSITNGSTSVSYTFSGSASDPNSESGVTAQSGTIIRYRWDYENNGTWDARTSNSGFTHTYPDLKADSTFIARFCAMDDDSNEVCANRIVRIVNHAPVLGTLVATPAAIVTINHSITLTPPTLTDLDNNQVDSITWSFSDGAPARTKYKADTIQLVRASSVIVTVTATAKDKYNLIASRNLPVEFLGPFVDTRDGQSYQTVLIGSQVWMAQNLNYSGDNGSGGRSYTKGWCYGVGGTDTTQHQDSTSCNGGYGRLYTWADVMGLSNAYLTTMTTAGMITTSHKGICPTSWHVPTQATWDSLTTFIRTDKGIDSGNEGKYLKGVISPDPNSWNGSTFNAQNLYGFSALPAGYRGYFGSWSYRTYGADFWAADESDATLARSPVLDYSLAFLNTFNFNKGGGLALRCARD